MGTLESGLIKLLLEFLSVDTINTWMRDPRTVAILVGALVSLSGAWLGTFLLLRKMSLTSDAISHTVLLGIVVAFFVLLLVGAEPSLSSPWLLIGASLSGVLTVALTEFVQRSKLLKADAALGLVFPFLFALAIILISRFADDVHLDTDAVLVGEIGVAWANANSYCQVNCDEIIITPESPLAETGRRCTNCSDLGISPRDANAVFEEYCSNCGTYTAAEAWRERLIDTPPTLVFWPKSLTVIGLITLLNILFVTLFYKELKLVTFDEALAKSLGFRPVALTYALMSLVSLTAVGAFDAVGSILVVAFFVIPAATAYLLTDRLSIMLLMSPFVGVLGSITGYELARGWFLGLPMSSLLEWLDMTIGLGGNTDWNVSISASIVIMTFFFFLLGWIFSPRYGLISMLVVNRRDKQRFRDMMLLGHIDHHQDTLEEQEELAIGTLHHHLNWSKARLQTSLARTRLYGWVTLHDGIVALTPRGRVEIKAFRDEHLRRDWDNSILSYPAVGD